MEDNVMKYIIEQSDRYDGQNMQFEQDILFVIKRLQNVLYSKVCNIPVVDASSLINIQSMMSEIQRMFDLFNRNYKKIVLDKFHEYAKRGYDQTDNLLQIGKEVQGKFNKIKIKELKGNNEYDDTYVDIIQEHVFSMMHNYEVDKVNRLRSELNNMLLSGNFNKAKVRAMIEKVMSVSRSKAEEITQNELSRAYNYGVTERLKKFKNESGGNIRKYWHGFKYSENTCDYCAERIGGIYDIDDDTEVLPAHVRCRCVWLPVMDGWDSPVSTSLIARANMLNTAYSADMLYNRINNRLGISYADYLDKQVAIDYLSGDRSQKVLNAIANAREDALTDTMSMINIAKETKGSHMSEQFNTQLKFWKEMISSAVVDGDKELLDRCVEGIKGIMVLPWNTEQLNKWNDVINRAREMK